MSTRRAARPQTKQNKIKGKGKGKGQSTNTIAQGTPKTTAGVDNKKTEKNEEDDDDEENDPDFVPTATGAADESASGSETSDSDGGNGRRDVKKVKFTAVEPGAANLEEERRKKEETRQKLWEEFQASVSTPPPRKAPERLKTVKVVKKYRFAGEDVTKVEEVPENSADAKKWPLWDPIKHAALDKPPPNLQTQSSPSPILSSSGTPQPQSSTSTPNADTMTTQMTTAATATIPAATTTKPPRPGPRRARKSLDTMFAEANAKAKKLSTLDKSAMDWKQHIDSDASKEIKEDLEANRRGGGYLEKVAFLQRVEERSESVREEAIGRKRRRG